MGYYGELRARYRDVLRAEVRRTVDTEGGGRRTARVAPCANGRVRETSHGNTTGIRGHGLFDMR